MGDDRHVFGGQKVLYSQSSIHMHMVVERLVVLASTLWPPPPHVRPKPPQDFGVELHVLLMV